MVMSLVALPGPSGDPVPLTWGTQITNNSNEFVDILTEPTSAWTVYTPTWASTGTAVSLGNGTIAGRFMRFGKLGFFNGILTTGGTTTYGTGTYTFSLPVTWTAVSAVGTEIGTGRVFDTSTSTRYIASVEVGTSGTVITLGTHAATTDISGTVPVTLASGDIIRWAGVVELT